MKKYFVKPSISVDTFSTEHILQASSGTPEKTNIDAAGAAFDAIEALANVLTITLD